MADPLSPDNTGASDQSSNAKSRKRRTANSNKPPRKRTKTGCLTCRQRRIKCDEGKPTCYNCLKSNKLCQGYRPPWVFRESASGDPPLAPQGMLQSQMGIGQVSSPQGDAFLSSYSMHGTGVPTSHASYMPTLGGVSPSMQQTGSFGSREYHSGLHGASRPYLGTHQEPQAYLGFPNTSLFTQSPTSPQDTAAAGQRWRLVNGTLGEERSDPTAGKSSAWLLIPVLTSKLMAK